MVLKPLRRCLPAETLLLLLPGLPRLPWKLPGVSHGKWQQAKPAGRQGEHLRPGLGTKPSAQGCSSSHSTARVLLKLQPENERKQKVSCRGPAGDSDLG